RSDLTKQLGTPTVHLWYHFWYFFTEHVERQPQTLAELTLAIPEFHHMVSEYHNLCVAPVFERLPEPLRATLTDRDRSRLNGFQQRHAFFIAEYEAFVKRLSVSRPSLQILPSFLPRSNPL